MRVLPFEIPKNPNTTLIYQEDCGPIFYNKLHQHKEVQVSFIRSGQGTLFIGDNIGSFKENDMIIIGSNLPHLFKSNNETNSASHMQSIFFNIESIQNSFNQLLELAVLNPFFEDCKYGFKISDHDAQFANCFNQIKEANPFYRIQYFQELLYLATNDAKQLLSSKIYKKPLKAEDGLRMQKIIDFTIENFKNEIRLNEVSNIASMSANAFCRYFKNKTNKSYFDYVNELRVEYACKQLLAESISIAEISSLSGFNSHSYFNRVFRRQKHMTPKEYIQYHNLV